jgi:tRNA dimethylallyltransferase
MQALGYRQLGAHLDGACTLEEAVQETVAATVAYARRQRTWFRKEAAVARLAAAVPDSAPETWTREPWQRIVGALAQRELGAP